MSAEKCVKVFVRIRPTSKFSAEAIELHGDKKSLTIHGRKDESRGNINNQILHWKYTMNGVLHNTGQQEVYEQCAKAAVLQSLDGINSTIMAYGQTGAGKTFTMSGSCENFQQRGIVPRTISQLFNEISKRQHFSIAVRVSYLEIYNETLYDLLSTLPGTPYVHPSLLTIREEQGPYCCVKGLSLHVANTEEEALNLFFEGEMNRLVASHSLNRNSSRSHCIFTIYIETRSRVESCAQYVVSKINLVDLAGSERIGKTKSEGLGQEEALYINKSLSFLEQVVIALGEKNRKHVPFRQSKLTHVLSDSIGGRSNTILIANIWGEECQLEETISTLRFGARMRSVDCEPMVNELYDAVRQCRNYEEEIRCLKNELAMHDTLSNRSQVVYEPLSVTQCKELEEEVKRFIANEVPEINIVNLRQVKEILEIFRKIVKSVEKNTEKKLRDKFNFQERVKTPQRRDTKDNLKSTAASNSQEVKQVGDSDGRGFGVGPSSGGSGVAATMTQKANMNVLLSGRAKTKSRKGKEVLEIGEQKPIDSQGQDAGDIRSSDTAGTAMTARPSTPPSKSQAFNEFKQERGSEINKIFTDNKEILRSKKKESQELSLKINAVKYDIDSVSKKLEMKRKEREEMGGSVLPETDQQVIDEDEFKYLQNFQELKQQYRVDYEELRNLKSDIQCCEKFVAQCRKRLVSEFEIWYAECYLSEESLNHSDNDELQSKSPVLEDEQEKFDRLQLEYLMDEPESVAYYNAQMQTQRRAYYTDVGRQRLQKPGAVQKRTKQPPNTMTVF